jgi:long-chain acyl-CoA synthetase
MDAAWLGRVPALRWERHYGDRVVRCFVERPASSYALLAEAAARNPDGEALVCGDERLSYRELETAVERCAAGLVAHGISRGDRVALLLGNGIAFPVTMFAALRLGAIAVPLTIREQSQGLAYMLGHSGAKLLVHDAALAARLPEPAATPALVHRIALEPGPYSAIPLLAPPVGATPAVVQEEDAAIILYTSGTTGRPKGAVLTHAWG